MKNFLRDFRACLNDDRSAFGSDCFRRVLAEQNSAAAFVNSFLDLLFLREHRFLFGRCLFAFTRLLQGRFQILCLLSHCRDFLIFLRRGRLLCRFFFRRLFDGLLCRSRLVRLFFGLLCRFFFDRLFRSFLLNGVGRHDLFKFRLSFRRRFGFFFWWQSQFGCRLKFFRRRKIILLRIFKRRRPSLRFGFFGKSFEDRLERGLLA